MNGFWEKCKKNRFWAKFGSILAIKGHFFNFPKKCENNIFYCDLKDCEKKRKTTIFGRFGTKMPILDSFWPKWAKKEFFMKALWTFLSRLQETASRTNGCYSLRLQRLRQETKNRIFYVRVLQGINYFQKFQFLNV